MVVRQAGRGEAKDKECDARRSHCEAGSDAAQGEGRYQRTWRGREREGAAGVASEMIWLWVADLFLLHAFISLCLFAAAPFNV